MPSLRYFYFKNGDAIAQMKRVYILRGVVPDGGPDAFLADLLSTPQLGSMLLCSYAEHNACMDFGNVAVRTYKQDSLLEKLASFCRLLLAIIAFRPQRILCGRTGAALAACILAGFILRIPVVFSAHTGISGQRDGLLADLGDYIDALLIRRCHAAICHGPHLELQLHSIGVPKARVFVFDSGCSDIVGDTREPHQPSQLPTCAPHILYLGRIVRGKGVFDLLQAFSEIVNSGLNANLDYVGGGNDLDALKEGVILQRIDDKVHVIGPLAHSEVSSVIRAAWAVVTPTRSELPEGRCMSAMEALACGIPVVAPDAGPFPYLVKNGVNGLLFEQDSVAGLASAIRRLITEPGLRASLSENAFRDRHQLIEPEVRFGGAVTKAFNMP